jgi:hypothetical protein
MSEGRKKLKLLHTSDWHIGRTLYGRKRYEEFEAFLNWLTDTIQELQVDACSWRVMYLTPALRAIVRRSSIIDSFAG